MGNAAYNTFIPVYLNSRGFGNTAVGLLLAIGPFIAILGQPVWGVAGDRAKSKNSILMILIFGSASAVLFYTLSDSFVYLFFLISLFTFFQTSIIPISDAITLEYLDHTNYRYGIVRLGGTVGFAVMSVIAGFVAKHQIGGIFPLYFGIYLLALLCVVMLPKVKGHQSGGHKVSPLKMFKNRRFVLLMLFSLIIQTTFGFYYSFFPIYYRQLGAGSDLLGWSMLISSICEVPFLLFADRIMKKFSVEAMLIASASLMALRWLLFSIVTDKFLILLIQPLHGVNFIVFAYSLAVYINEKMPKELKASGQAVNGLISLGLARIIGSMLGGVFSDYLGIKQMFFYNAVIAAAAAILFGFLFFRGNKKGEDVFTISLSK